LLFQTAPQALGKPIDSMHFLADESAEAAATARLDFFSAS
jgi:hypothetical protein